MGKGKNSPAGSLCCVRDGQDVLPRLCSSPEQSKRHMTVWRLGEREVCWNASWRCPLGQAGYQVCGGGKGPTAGYGFLATHLQQQQQGMAQRKDSRTECSTGLLIEKEAGSSDGCFEIESKSLLQARTVLVAWLETLQLL